MKCIFHVVIMTAAILGFLSGAGIGTKANAESMEGKSAIGLNLMYVMGSSLDSSSGYGLNYTYGFAKDQAIEVSLDRSSHNLLGSETDINVTKAGDISMTTLMVSAQYRPEIASLDFSPYVGFGLGYSIVSVDLSSELMGQCIMLSGGYPCRVDVNNAFAYSLSLGVDRFISEKIAIALEGRYTISTASGTIYAEDDYYEYEISGDFDLDRYDLRAGVKYYF